MDRRVSRLSLSLAGVTKRNGEDPPCEDAAGLRPDEDIGLALRDSMLREAPIPIDRKAQLIVDEEEDPDPALLARPELSSISCSSAI
jgi:hypothetical protein